MRLYHGTNIDFDAIDLTKSNPYKDFGKGFYLTSLRIQAEALAQKRAVIFGGEPVVQEYEFDETSLQSSKLKILIFNKPTKEWAEFIYKNRSRHTAMDNSGSYDIVIGPIADDGVAYLLSRYEEGSFTLDELAKELEFKRLNNQYFFGTEDAVKLLKRIR